MPRFRPLRLRVHTARRVGAALLVVAALVLALRPDASASPDRPPPEQPVAVAAADLAAGSVLRAADLAVTGFPTELVPAGSARDPTSLIGRTLAGALRGGEPVTDARLVGPGVTARLPEGQVAAPVRLADLAVAALARAGDRVDVLATRPDAATAELVAASALVLAAPGGSTDDPAAGLLLLAVDPATAAALAAASASATLTLSLPGPP